MPSARRSIDRRAPEAFERPLLGRRFYLDVRDSRVAASVAASVARLGASVELFLVESVTHVVTDDPECPTRGVAVVAAAERPAERSAGRRVSGYRTRTDAMLESAREPEHDRSPGVLQRARLWNIPVWSVKKVEWFLEEIDRAIRKKIGLGLRVLGPEYLKFESSDRRHRAVFGEPAAWPTLHPRPDRTGSPFAGPARGRSMRSDGRAEHGAAESRCARARTGVRPVSGRGAVRGSGPRPGDLSDEPPKKDGYCEMCRMAYSALSDHRRTPAHAHFIRDRSNFSSLDASVARGPDADAFLNMNRSNERRSLRNVAKIEAGRGHALCNGDDRAVAPLDADPVRRLRPKARENDGSCPGERRKASLGNGSLGPPGDASDGDEERGTRGAALRNARPRSIRWRRPSPESNPAPPDARTYYRVVGVSSKLKHPDCVSAAAERSPPRSRRHCNGESEPGLVVKFRRVRRSELSVLSDEAENFMFPKKDESDSTEDEVETSGSFREGRSTELLTSPDCRVKEEILSGDDGSRDSGGSDFAKRRGRKPARKPSSDCNKNEVSESERKRRGPSESPEADDSPPTEPIERCLRWEEGRLRTSPEVESLSFTFERVPSCEPWYDTFKRQDLGQENRHNVAEYLGYYWKSPILPYEMGNLPPLKPNCCHLSQYKKVTEPKLNNFPRKYGTRGMKKKKLKGAEIVAVGRNPRKSPREHASTLAILGGLVNKRRTNKLSGSDDTKSLPSITEEETSSDAPLIFKLPEVRVSDSAKRLEEFFSSLEDGDEYDTLVHHMDDNVDFGKTAERSDVIRLLEDYESCDLIERNLEEMRDRMRRADGGRRRKGHRFKKKNNRTGWPAKKKSQTKRDVSSRDASATRDGAAETDGTSAAPQESRTCPADRSASENNDNSIMSCSDSEEKTSDGVKCGKTSNETETSISDSENFSNGVDENVPEWERPENDSGRRTNGGIIKSLHSNKDLQPIVRVQKIDTKVSPAGRRKLRSSGPKRRLRGRYRR